VIFSVTYVLGIFDILLEVRPKSNVLKYFRNDKSRPDDVRNGKCETAWNMWLSHGL
jgi:hypothetical protein